jgi:hypothetical protein
VPTEPTGREHLTPVNIEDTSATERAGFRTCRRRWFLTSVHRLDPQEGNPNFFVGNLVHRALEIYYVAQERGEEHDERVDLALQAFQTQYTAEMGKLKDQLGFLWSFAEPQWKALGEMAFEMVQNYFDAELQAPLFDEVIAVETRVFVPIIDPDSGATVGVLSVQTDIVGRKDGERKVVDTKTASRTIDGAHLDIDDQLSAEVYSDWIDSGEFASKAVYNVLYKKVARPPKQIKGSKKEPIKLSRAKDQGTTYQLYREEIEKLGLNKANYVEILAHLKEKEEQGENVFFAREETFRTPEQMRAFERDLFFEFDDMVAVGKDPRRAYPNPSKFNCAPCPVRTICITIQDDGDVEAIIQAGYVVADPRR